MRPRPPRCLHLRSRAAGGGAGNIHPTQDGPTSGGCALVSSSATSPRWSNSEPLKIQALLGHCSPERDSVLLRTHSKAIALTHPAPTLLVILVQPNRVQFPRWDRKHAQMLTRCGSRVGVLGWDPPRQGRGRSDPASGALTEPGVDRAGTQF